MLPSYVLALREGLEAALIIGIVIGTLRKINRPELGRTVWIGSLSAAALSTLIALLLNSMGASLEGKAEQIFEGFTMLVAAGVLTWMIFWMRRQARSLKNELETGVRHAAIQAGKGALFFLAFTAVLREGIELALFLTAAALASDAQQVLTGALLGLGTAILFGWSLFASILKLDLRLFFQVTGAMLILFAAGLVAYGVHELNEAGWVPVIVEHLWDINFILDEKSTAGAMLKALFGYNGNPSLTEVLAYLAYFIGIYLGLRREAIPTLRSKQEVQIHR
ncbi:MAG TPA: iron uptake transporter permease EfeU [Anaerolineales bacterium]|nr:iron uptake transporter permease EfeU [Anaerolineales bacterium]